MFGLGPGKRSVGVEFINCVLKHVDLVLEFAYPPIDFVALDLCESAAPFKGSDGLPYLEVHPLTALSEGGELSYGNLLLVGLCPNCHARLHDLQEDEDIARLTKKLNTRIKRRS